MSDKYNAILLSSNDGRFEFRELIKNTLSFDDLQPDINKQFFF